MSLSQKIVDEYSNRLDDDWDLRKKKLSTFTIRDGYLMHVDSCARAGSMRPGSYLHQLWIRSLQQHLVYWHEMAEELDIMYTLIASNLISYYCTNNFLPWEDDIDITVNVKSWRKLNRLYEQWDDVAPWWRRKWSHVIGNWGIKVCPDNSDIYICRGRAGRMKFVHKSRFDIARRHSSPTKIRGIDISVAIPVEDHYIESFWAYRNVYPVCPALGDDITKKQCPVVDYAGVKTRVINEEIGGKYLDERYGTKWRSCIQPRLIVKKTKLICEKIEFDKKCINNIIVNFCNENRHM